MIINAKIMLNDAYDEDSAKDTIFLRLEEMTGFEEVEFSPPDYKKDPDAMLCWITNELKNIMRLNDKIAADAEQAPTVWRCLNENNGIKKALIVIESARDALKKEANE